MKKLGLVLILSLIFISTFFIFFSINYPISKANSDKDRNSQEISYVQNDQPKISDSFEPNDNFSDASGPMTEGYYPGLNLSTDFDEDWFYIWVDSDKSLTVNLYFNHSEGDVDLELYNSLNFQIIGNYSVTDDESIIYYVNSSDNYYIRVYYRANPSYDLEIKIDDKFEPNNNFNNAIEIAKGWHSSLDCKDDDWFKFWINMNEKFTVEIFFLHSMGDLNMELRDNANNPLAVSDSLNDNEMITWTANYSGFHYIRIYNLTNNYDLDIYINSLSDDIFEPNNSLSNAVEIGKGWYSSLICKDDDWFKFWIEKDEEFTVEIFFFNNTGDLDMELYNNTYVLLAGSYSVFDNEMITWTANYSGFYYIRIYNYSFTVGNYYDLDIYIGWKWWDDEYEYNNDFWSAREVFKGLNRDLKCHDEDWYMIHLQAGEVITVDIFFFNDSGNLELEIHDNPPPAPPIWWANSLDDDETISFSATYTGYYFILVNKSSFDDDNEYDMKIGGQEILIFEEQFENPIDHEKWSGINEGGYMHVTSHDSSPDSPSKSLWCGNEVTGFYDKKNVNGSSIPYKESAIIKDLDLRDYCYVELTFDVKLSVGFNFNDYASISVNLLADEYYLSPKYTNYECELGKSNENTGGWVNQTVDLSFFSGYEHVDIIFNFEADEFDNYYEGVMIDNVRITGIWDDEPMGYDLGIHVGEEFYYYFPYVNQYSWSEIFHSGIPVSTDDEIKIRILSINDMGSYWEVTSLFWDPWDDFEEFAGTDEIKYKIYKNPINMKDGVDFFIPSGDIWRYFEKADNFDRDWTSYDITHWYDWYEHHIEYSFNEFTVHLIYMHTGVLKGMMIIKKDATYHRIIFEMWLGEPNDEEDEDEEDERAIPGYDIFLISFLISVVSIVSAIKIKKSKKTKE